MVDSGKATVNRNNPGVNGRLTMKYTKEKRLDIGHRIYEGELSRYQAVDVFGISDQTARSYMRLCRDANQLPAKHGATNSIKAASFQTATAGMEELGSVTKEQLIQELVKARITEAR